MTLIRKGKIFLTQLRKISCQFPKNKKPNCFHISVFNILVGLLGLPSATLRAGFSLHNFLTTKKPEQKVRVF